MLTDDEKVRIFKALGNKTRLAILINTLKKPYICGVNGGVRSEDLIKQAACVGSIAQEFNFTAPTISRHLKELREANLINMYKEGNRIFVVPNVDAVREISGFIDSLLPKS